MVAVAVPISVLKGLGGTAVDDQIALGILIQTANDIEHGGLAAAGRTQDRHKFVLPELQIHTRQGVNNRTSRRVILLNILKFQHKFAPFCQLHFL